MGAPALVAFSKRYTGLSLVAGGTATSLELQKHAAILDWTFSN
jgi:hypothetical protein